jgi:hypothetical protein
MDNNNHKAIRHHGDGSVTICPEMVEQILLESDIPEWLKGWLAMPNAAKRLAAINKSKREQGYVTHKNAK